jgi:hypothetical protein
MGIRAEVRAEPASGSTGVTHKPDRLAGSAPEDGRSLATDRLRSLRNLVVLTIHPLEGRVVAVLGALALIGLPTAVGRLSNALAALLTLVALLAVLLAIAGYKLQRAHDRRMRPEFKIERRVEYLPGAVRRLGDQEFHEPNVLWVRVTNLGPDAEFVARVENVRNARHAATLTAVDEGYSVDRIAWYDKQPGRRRLSRGEVGVLHLAEHALATGPGIPHDFVVYFLEPPNTSNPGEPRAGWRLNASLGCIPITFDLTVSNVSNVTADTQVTERLSIGYDSGQHVAFDVVSSRSGLPFMG